MVSKEIPGGKSNDPIGHLTNLGWVCFGPTLLENFRSDSHSYFSRTYRSQVANRSQLPDDAICRFWELDAIGIKDDTCPCPMTAEKAAVEKVSGTLKFAEGRYEIGIPWKDDEPKFADNYEAAMKHNGKSLNSAIRPGPKLQREIVDVLIRFRMSTYVDVIIPCMSTTCWTPVIRYNFYRHLS